MDLKRTIVAITATATLLAPVAVAEAKPAKAYRNCAQLNRVYKHGVGKPHARDHTSTRAVTNFRHSQKLYNANTKLDRDKDGIACEKL